MGRRAVDRARDRELTVTDPKPGKSYPDPVIGEDVYHPSVLYLTHGTDDFRGGLCEVLEVLDKPNGVFVRLKEYADWEVSWLYLMEGQDEWRRQYGDQRGRPDPDDRPEFNEPWPASSTVRACSS